MRNASLLQEVLDLLLGILPGQPVPIAAFQVPECAFTVQLGDTERGLLVHETLSNEIFARHGKEPSEPVERDMRQDSLEFETDLAEMSS